MADGSSVGLISSFLQIHERDLVFRHADSLDSKAGVVSASGAVTALAA